MVDYSKYRNLSQAIKSTPEEEEAGMGLPSFSQDEIAADLTFAQSGGGDGWENVEAPKLIKAKANDGWEDVKPVDEGWEDVMPKIPSPKEKKSGPSNLVEFALDPYGDPLKLKGAAKQVTDVASTMVNLPGRVGAAIYDLFQGNSPTQVLENQQQFQKTSVPGSMMENPPEDNPVIAAVFEAVHKGVTGYLDLQTVMSNTLREKVGMDKEQSNKLAKSYAEEALMLLGGARSKAGADFIEGKFKRVPNEPEPPIAISQLKEQAAFEKNRADTEVQNFNQAPEKFGVDESGARNPYEPWYDVTPDQNVKALPPPPGYKSAGPEMEGPAGTESTFTEKHQKMVALGDSLIKDMEDKGLTPKAVSEMFWKETYPLLPEEVQIRFSKLAERNEKSRSPIAEALGELQGMQKWQIALMHEANNHAWNPKVKVQMQLRNSIDNLPDEPVEMQAGKNENQSIFPTNDPKITEAWLKELVKTDKQFGGKPGSINKFLAIVRDHSTDPMEQLLGRLLIDPRTDGNVRVQEVPKENTSYGTALVSAYNPTEIRLNISEGNMAGISTNTFLHEALHHRILKILNLGGDTAVSERYPEYRRFTDEVGKLWTDLRQFLPKDMQEHFRSAFYGKQELSGQVPGHELISWGLADRGIGGFRTLLDNIWVEPNGTLSWYHDKLTKDAQKIQGETARTRFIKLVTDTLARDEDGKTYPLFTNPAKFNKLQTHLEAFVGEKITGNTALEELITLVAPILEHANAAELPSTMDLLDAMNGQDIKLDSLVEHSAPPKKVLPKLITPFDTYGQLQQWADAYKYNDLNKVTGNFYPVTKVKDIANNPVVTYATSKLRDIHGASRLIEKFLVDSVKPFKLAPPDMRQRITVALNEANRPEQQEMIRFQRQQNNIWPQNPLDLTDQELQSFGMQPNDIALYRQTLEPLFKSLLKLDQASIAKGFNRVLQSDVIGYYPRSFGYGRFWVRGFDPTTGELKYLRYNPTFKDNTDIERTLKSQGLMTARGVNKDFNDYKGHMQAMVDMEPKGSLTKVLEGRLAAMEEHRRTQEFERHAKGVAGFIGQQINNPKEVALLEQMIFHRIALTTEAYRAARLLDEVARPIRGDLLAHYYYPNAVEWVADVVNRELGGDISEAGLIDKGVQLASNFVYKQYVKRTSWGSTVQLKPNEQVLDPIFSKQTAGYLTATGSFYVLAGNVPNMVTNSFSLPLVSLLGGIPDSLMLNDSWNPYQIGKAVATAFRAHTQSTADLAEILLHRLGANTGDPQVRNFIKRAYDRGLVTANAFNDIPEMRAEIEKSTFQKGMDIALNTPRKYFNDPIEVATNIVALLYYNRLVLKLKPGLSEAEHFALVHSLAKSYTGEYEKFNRSLMWDKAGIAGKMASNFSTWTQTRAAQFHELVKNVAVHKQLTPLLALLTSAILVAGLEGAPVAQDWENIRQRMMGIDVDIKPLNLVLKENDVPAWLREGVILNSTGLDLQSRGKWAGFTDIGGVTYLLPGKVKDIYDYSYMEMASVLGKNLGERPVGADIAQTADMVKGLPNLVQPAARQKLLTIDMRNDGKTSVMSKYGKTAYTQELKEWPANILGFKTPRQADESKEYYNSLYEEKMYEKRSKDLKKHFLDQLIMSLNAESIGDKSRADALMKDAVENYRKYQEKNAAAEDAKRLAHEIQESLANKTDTVEERLIKDMARSGKNAGKVKMFFKSYTRAVTSRKEYQ